MHECLHECLHSFQHFEVCKKIVHQHGEVEDLINKEAINHDSFLRTRTVCYDTFSYRVLTIQTLCRVCQFQQVVLHPNRTMARLNRSVVDS